ncbi:MAG: beta propeller protein, partial [Paenibacillus sp.]|nr:beta propeller protein [Paenibacillus sp.]
MKKGLPLACLLAFTLFLSGASQPSAETESRSGIRLSLNGQAVTFSSMPMLTGNTLMVPLRDLSEALEVKVNWDENAQSATAVKGDRSIKLTMDSEDAFRGEQPIRLESAPRLESGKLFVPLRFFSESFDFNVYWDGLNKTVAIHDADKSLPTVGSPDNMKELLKDYGGSASAISVTTKQLAIPESAQSAVKERASAKTTSDSATSNSASAPSAASAPQSEAKAAYSGTNVQVEGVDESDIIKTDGSYIYQVNKNRIIITAAYPAEQMKVVQTLSFDDKNFRANELYIDDKHMVVIGGTSYPFNDKAY